MKKYVIGAITVAVLMGLTGCAKPVGMIDDFEALKPGEMPAVNMTGGTWVFAAGQAENVTGSGKFNYCSITATVKEEAGNKYLELVSNVRGLSWPWSEGILTLNKKGTPVDVRKMKGLRFKMKTTTGKGDCANVNYIVMLSNPEVSDYSKYMKTVTPSKDWVTVEIPFTGAGGFEPAGWGLASTTPADKYLARVNDIHFNINQGGSEANKKGCGGQVWCVDDVEVY